MNEMNELWHELAEESESNALTIKVADTISNIIVKLIQTRVGKGLTQKQVADMAGIKQPAVARLESLESFPRIDTIVKVATVLGLKLKLEVE